MKYKSFGNTDLKVSEIGLGCSYLGGTLERGTTNPNQILHDAFDKGINFFDTADIYSQGNSEKIVGNSFKKMRDQVIISTKVGFYLSNVGSVSSKFKPLYRYISRSMPWLKSYARDFRSSQKKQDFSTDYITRAVENCLKRLQTDYIDILQLHNPETGQLESGELLDTLDRLRQAGKIRYYGVSCRNIEDALVFLKYAGISTLQVPINLLEQEAVGYLLPGAKEKGIAVVARQPLAGGTIFRSNNVKDSENEDSAGANNQKHEQVNKFSFLFDNGSRTISQAAMKYVLQLQGVSVVLVGTTNQNHLKEIVDSTDLPLLTEEEMSRIHTIGATL